MFNLVALSSLHRICIFMPDADTAKELEAIFIAEGLPAVSVTRLGEFETAIKSGHHTAIVTVSSCISAIRKVSDLPIIDIQSLIDDWRRTAGTRRPSAFEVMTFLQGVCFIAVRR